MTKEEKQLLIKDLCSRLPCGDYFKAAMSGDNAKLNARHFDYRGLIGKMACLVSN